LRSSLAWSLLSALWWHSSSQRRPQCDRDRTGSGAASGVIRTPVR
jgi:hypothetical protein